MQKIVYFILILSIFFSCNDETENEINKTPENSKALLSSIEGISLNTAFVDTSFSYASSVLASATFVKIKLNSNGCSINITHNSVGITMSLIDSSYTLPLKSGINQTTIVVSKANCDTSKYYIQITRPNQGSKQPTISKAKELFDLSKLSNIRLEISTTEWNKFLNYFDQNEHNEEYIMGNFVFDRDGSTQRIDSVGIRLRGNTSRRRPEGSLGEVHNSASPDWHHASFNVNFKKYNSAKRFYGLEKILIKWFKDDADYCREVYCYDLFRRFGVWSAPLASYSKLSIKINEDSKVAYFGVYEMIESIEEQYLTDRFIDGKLNGYAGDLWKCSYVADLKLDGIDAKMGIEDIQLDATKSKTYQYDLKTNKKSLELAKTQLRNFVTALNSTTSGNLKSWLEANVDVDLFLRAMAVNVLVGMWDDYWVNANNFYFYFDANGKLIFIPFDYDNTLGTSLIVKNSGTKDVLSWGSSSNRPLINKILSVSEFKEKYKAYIKELINPNNDYFDATKSIARIQFWQNMISKYISNDTGEDMAIEDKPAEWGNCGFYKLLTGNDLAGVSGDANYFKTRIKNIPF